MTNEEKLKGLIELEARIRNSWMPGTGYAALVEVIKDYELRIAALKREPGQE